MFQHHDEYEFKKIIDEFILSSSNNKTIKNIDVEAFKLGISFYEMIFILIRKYTIHNRNIKDILKQIWFLYFYNKFLNNKSNLLNPTISKVQIEPDNYVSI